jgi:hypothetical protein
MVLPIKRFILSCPFEMMFPCAAIVSAHVDWCFDKRFGSKEYGTSANRDKLRQAHFFTRETPSSSDTLKFSLCADRHARINPEKLCVVPIGYALPGFASGGPQFRKTIAANLAAFASALACRNLNSLPR